MASLIDKLEISKYNHTIVFFFILGQNYTSNIVNKSAIGMHQHEIFLTGLYECFRSCFENSMRRILQKRFKKNVFNKNG